MSIGLSDQYCIVLLTFFFNWRHPVYLDTYYYLTLVYAYLALPRRSRKRRTCQRVDTYSCCTRSRPGPDSRLAAMHQAEETEAEGGEPPSRAHAKARAAVHEFFHNLQICMLVWEWGLGRAVPCGFGE